MRNKWTWILLAVGSMLGSLLFTCMQAPDASAILKLPSEARITRVEDRGLSGEVWFEMPSSRSPEEWLQAIGSANGYERDTDDRWQQIELQGLVRREGFVEYSHGVYHASRRIVMPKAESLK